MAYMTKREIEMKALREGRYKASCKERSFLAAVLNGHSLVYPEARCIVAQGRAVFDHNGVEVWQCNAEYAALHFVLEPID
jgi:hypothetical protein